MKKIPVILAFLLIISSLIGCSNIQPYTEVSNDNSESRQIILNGNSSDDERNSLLKEDIAFFKEELPKKHKNPFSVISREEFEERTSKLEENVDKLDNHQVFSELGKIIASIKDAHTSTNYWDGKKYPLEFYLINDDMYVVNTDESLKDMIYSKIISVDGVSWDILNEELSQQISYENESWLNLMLSNYFLPAYLYSAGVKNDLDFHMFNVEKDGEIQKFQVPILSYKDPVNFYWGKSSDKMLGNFEKYYDYTYVQENKTLYFEYNVCADMEDMKFKDFNDNMFQIIESNEVENIIVDLRGNSGGDSEILNPFTERLKSYVASNDDVKIYILVGRSTMSSGMFAIFRIKEAAPDAISIGEPTGGAIDCYGEVKVFYLPNSQLPIQYSTKYFEFSKVYNYVPQESNTYTPDILISPSIGDFMNNNDLVLKHVFK